MKDIKIIEGQVPQRVPNHFHPGMEQNFAIMQWHITAVIEYLESREPGVTNEIARRVFYHKCFTVMLSREKAMDNATPANALEISATHNNMVEKLEKEATDKEWMGTFNRALMNAKQMAKES